MVGYDPGLRGIAYDPARARTLLAQAGYPDGRGMPAINYLVDQDAQSLVLANELARQWQRVLGIRIQLLRRDHTAYNLQLSRRDYQIAVIDWTADYPDPQNFLSQLLHSGYPNNNGDWHDATFDRLVDEADHMAADSPARLQRYHEAESIAMEQAAGIPLVNPTGGILLRSTIRGMEVEGGQIMVADWTKVSIATGGDT
jgi:ABC-type oligopeptide transport system substrate-binding subunit